MPSNQENLRNLQKIGKLKAEPPAQAEINELTKSAENKLRDAENATNSPDSRFSLAYGAAHSLA
jgi:vacuolar-type H+-ATPase subunit H